MGYKEEIFERVEKQFKSIQNQIRWLNSFERPKKVTDYTKIALKVRDDLREVTFVKDDINNLSEIDDLNKIVDIKNNIDSIEISKYKSELISDLDRKSTQVVEREVERGLLGEASEQVLGRAIDKSEYKELWKTDRSASTKIAIRMKSIR